MNKSKFLKKSLAMLLALMLVVAMIPLSASAALTDDLKFINIDGDQVAVGASMEVELSSSKLNTGEEISIHTYENLGNVELRVFEKDGSVEYKAAKQLGTTSEYAVADYVDVSSDKTTGTVKMALVDTKGTTTAADDETLATYTLTITFVKSNTTANLEVVKPTTGLFGDGVYNAYVDGDEIIVETARINTDAEDENDAAWTQDANPIAKIKVKALDDASITKYEANNAPVTVATTEAIVDANNGDKVTVVSQDTSKTITYTVVSKYVDALDSFTVTANDVEYTGTFSDANKDDVVDTITVVLPKSVLVNASNGDEITSPELPVSFKAKGNVNADVVVKIPDTANPGTAVKTDGTVSVKFTDLGDEDNKGEITGTVDVTRLNGFIQQYNLIVKTEDSTNTTIAYARVNTTEATIDGANISAVLPKSYDGKPTDRENVNLVLYTEDTVEKVIIGSQTAKKITGEANAADQTAWGFLVSDSNNDIDASSPVTISVYAEDGHFEQYTLTTSMAEQTNTAGMSAIWIGKGSKTYEGNVTGTNEYTITIPYMTTDISDWVVYATPTSGSKVTNAAKDKDIVNGITKVSEVGFTSADKLPLIGSSTKLTAQNMADENLVTVYDVKVVLETAKDSRVIKGLDFTAQVDTNDTDEEVYRALSDENQFHAYVAQKSDGSMDAGNINLYVPKSLLDHKEDYYGANTVTYYNVVTGFEVPDGGVVFYSDSMGGTDNKDMHVKELDATVDDDDRAYLTGTVIKNGKWIVVVPEQIARQLLLDELECTNHTKDKEWLPEKYLSLCTVYTVKINEEDYATDSTLESFKVGDKALTVVNTEKSHAITGELPWSYTIDEDDLSDPAKVKDAAKFAEFVLSDYAAMRSTEGTGSSKAFNSKGDIDGNGSVDPIGNDNAKFVFVRDDDNNKVSVKYIDAAYVTSSSDTDIRDLSSVVVRAEDRLNTTPNYKVSQTEYTFDLTWAEPSKEAEITSFKLANQTGTVTNTSETERTIKVNVPYGTDLKGMVATFEASLGATVKVGTISGIDFISGVTSLNYTSNVIVYVTSEDGSVTNRYTITVDEGISFSDVNSTDWFYDNVMDAVENGYMVGMGDGTFAPMQSATRAQFAAALANALGYTADPDAPSMFPDVADNYWGKAAINFCVQNGIVGGYDNGTFQPDKIITRQEAAAMLNNAFKLTASSNVSKFTDSGRIASWATAHVGAVANAELMNGDTNGAFRPTGTLTRAELASILMNAKNHGFID